MRQFLQSYTEKELRRLSRADLLEMLALQSKEVEKLQEEIADLRAQLKDRTIMIQESGSIAEASLKLNGVFEAAEQAALQYLENIKRNSSAWENTCAGRETVPDWQQKEEK